VELFKRGTEILIEIENNDGNVLYTEIPNYIENSSRRVSISVYPDDADGIYLLTIVGILNSGLAVK